MASDTGGTWSKALLESLQQLYSKLSVMIVNRRMESYRKESGAHLDKEILSALYQIVDETPVSQNPKPGAVEGTESGQPDQVRLTERSKSFGQKQASSTSAPAATFTDLSNHMHASLSSNSETHPLGERLKASAWEHIHTALRYVREEKPDLAKMHANLAQEALQQASHHMTEEAYVELKRSVLEELGKLRTH